MQNNLFFWERFAEAPIIGIIRGLERETVWRIVPTYLGAGLNTLEITLNTSGALSMITDLRKEFPGLQVGAGTVCTMEEFDSAIKAGAQFIVAPIVNEEVIKRAVAMDLPIFPGAFSPTEIYNAWTLGASAVKLFPAAQLGPQYVKDVLAPLNPIKLLPTGGVSHDNIASFFKAGAFGVGMGGSLFDTKLIQSRDFKAVKAHFASVMDEIKEFLEG